MQHVIYAVVCTEMHVYCTCMHCIELYATGHKLHAIRAQTARLPGEGGVTYDETKRRGAYTKEDEMIRGLHRWPYRDKCGPAMVALLHHTWDIT